MKFAKELFKKMLPLVLVLILTWAASVHVYYRILNLELENCWDRLEIATQSTAQKISVRINDNINFIDAISDSFVLTEKLHDTKAVGAYLNTIMKKTLFNDIHVITSENEKITLNSERIKVSADITFNDLAKKGTHISSRMVDPFSGRKVIYCMTTINDKSTNEPIAVLVGTLDCEKMGEIFQVFTYGENAQLFVIDNADGNYIIDTWHNTLGNIHNLGQRRDVETGDYFDLNEKVLDEKSNRVSFVSQTNGAASYQYHSLVPDFLNEWTVAVVVQEDVVFSHANRVRDILLKVAFIELAFFTIVFLINFLAINRGYKRDMEAKALATAKSANEAKSKFIANMSHDIRTPLNAITGMLHIIKTHREEENLVNDCLTKIEVSAKYLITLTNDLLDINEIDSNRFVLEKSPLNLRKLVDDLSEIIKPKLQELDIDYEVDISEVVNENVLCSPVHIERVLLNLLTNAIKYSKENEPKICFKIEEEKVSSAKSLYKFIVKDNGIGMSEEFQKTMYDTFSQEKNTARSKYQGYGLGLAIVAKLVNKMNGNIDLESTKGVGSTFTVSIVLNHNENFVVSEEVSELADLTGLKILLVEDNDFNMEIAETVLADAGAVVTCAENGKIATEIFKESPEYSFDLIVMDIMMPELDGYEATKVIREMGKADSATIPIFAMTAHTFAEEVQSCIEAGMNEHIPKPINVEKLIRTASKYYKK